MSNLFWLTDAQMTRLEPFFPRSHGKPRVDDRRVLSGIIFIRPAKDALQPLEALEPDGCVHPYHDRPGDRGRR